MFSSSLRAPTEASHWPVPRCHISAAWWARGHSTTSLNTGEATLMWLYSMVWSKLGTERSAISLPFLNGRQDLSNKTPTASSDGHLPSCPLVGYGNCYCNSTRCFTPVILRDRLLHTYLHCCYCLLNTVKVITNQVSWESHLQTANQKFHLQTGTSETEGSWCEARTVPQQVHPAPYRTLTLQRLPSRCSWQKSQLYRLWPWKTPLTHQISLRATSSSLLRTITSRYHILKPWKRFRRSYQPF